MTRPLPNWSIWQQVPQLTEVEAVALSLNVDPQRISEWSRNKWVYTESRWAATAIEEFTDRIFLFRKCFGPKGNVGPAHFVAWTKSVGWDIPEELEKLVHQKPSGATICSKHLSNQADCNDAPTPPKNVWDTNTLRTLLEQSREPGMTHEKLSKKYNVSRAFIGRKLKDARVALGQKKATAFDPLNVGNGKR